MVIMESLFMMNILLKKKETKLKKSLNMDLTMMKMNMAKKGKQDITKVLLTTLVID